MLDVLELKLNPLKSLFNAVKAKVAVPTVAGKTPNLSIKSVIFFTTSVPKDSIFL